MKVNRTLNRWKRMTCVRITSADSRRETDRMWWPDGGWGAFIFVAIFQVVRGVIEG